jgi:hypothetical protein
MRHVPEYESVCAIELTELNKKQKNKMYLIKTFPR